MKKKNVNKLLALGLVSAMTAGMLAGCGNTASTTTDNGAADTTVTEATDDKKLPPILRRQTMVKCLL